MNPPDDELSPELRRALDALPRAQAPHAGLEDETVRRLMAQGVVRGGTMNNAGSVSVWWRRGALAATAALVAAVAGMTWPGGRAGASGTEYLLLLQEDSLYQAPVAAHAPERVAEYSRWADSLARAGRLVKAAELEGAGQVTGFFIVRAATGDEANRLAQTSPHVRYRGTVEVRKLVRH